VSGLAAFLLGRREADTVNAKNKEY
jgi:hypothetical protein